MNLPEPENRSHFLVDINRVFSLFGNRYFIIFYFGRHLHPRQKDMLVNQKKTANWVVGLTGLIILIGALYAIYALVANRLSMG